MNCGDRVAVETSRPIICTTNLTELLEEMKKLKKAALKKSRNAEATRDLQKTEKPHDQAAQSNPTKVFVAQQIQPVSRFSMWNLNI